MAVQRSISTAEKSTGTIEWVIDAWSALPKLHHTIDSGAESLKKSCTSSSQLSVAGGKWKFTAIPGGISAAATEATVANNKLNSCFYIHHHGYEESALGHRLEFTLTVVNQLAGHPNKSMSVSTTVEEGGPGHPVFMRRADIEDESKGWKVCV